IERHFGYHFDLIAAEPLYLSLARSESPILRAILDSPAHLKGMINLRADLDEAVAHGLLAPLDTELIAAALRGIAFEVGQAMVRRTPPDPAAATRFASSLLLSGLAWRPDP